eukprot:MONOS_8005.1-p1 / transcript=MONOS_8005.1 / gene=MONOS_8005 / organism=Monocercomonoides_exilis_PA203 / gene_product=unspecified product / transcript_product=unspecified product / location=Mono_scaffold00290:43891-45071(+) / protein_length=373 / sequence_SO=supercontig / SO=protein_coding / is_pseudo=false
MIEKKKMSMENATRILKHIGYCKVLKNVWNRCFEYSILNERFEKMIVEEDKKKEKKNEKLLIDLCECYLLLNGCASSELISTCVPCLLKVASVKEESEETRKEKEMALLTLSEKGYSFIEQELYLKKITEIIEHHQEHNNLTKLAYQSAWKFLINRFFNYGSLEYTVSNELHFGREAARELEELARCIDWKKKEGEEMNKEEAKEEITLMRWLQTSNIYFVGCYLQNEEYVELIGSIVQVFLAAKDNFSVINDLCIYPLRNAAKRRVVKVEDLLKGGAVYAILEGMQRPTLNKDIMNDGLQFLVNVSYRLKGKEKSENDEMKRKATKRKIFEKMEEKGYEDTITSFHEVFEFLNKKYYSDLSLNISDYLVNV